MERKFLMQEMSWPEFKKAMEDDPIVVVPIGSTEQHGPHLPLGTDGLVGFELIKRVVRAAPNNLKIIVAPPTYIGLSIEHTEFPGTLSFKDAESLISYMNNLCVNLVNHGAKKIVLWNSHGGNKAVMIIVARAVERMTGAFVLATNWFQLVKSWPERREFDIHGGEFETSMVLYLFPELVDMSKAQKELPEKFMNAKNIRSLKGDVSWLTRDLSKSGIIGEATKASKDQGKETAEELIKAAIELFEELAAW